MNEEISARQTELISWSELQSCGPGRRAVDVEDLLRQLLYSKDNDIVQSACARLENNAVPQGTLYECAPAVASAIMAAFSDDSQLAMESLEMLDKEHESTFLGARWNL